MVEQGFSGATLWNQSGQWDLSHQGREKEIYVPPRGMGMAPWDHPQRKDGRIHRQEFQEPCDHQPEPGRDRPPRTKRTPKVLLSGWVVLHEETTGKRLIQLHQGLFRMLVLTRNLGQKIYIGDNICLTVVEIDRGKVRLGIEAPRDVAIARDDVAKEGVQTMWGTVDLGGEA